MQTLPVFKQRLGLPKGSATEDDCIYTRDFEHCSIWLYIEYDDGKLT